MLSTLRPVPSALRPVPSALRPVPSALSALPTGLSALPTGLSALRPSDTLPRPVRSPWPAGKFTMLKLHSLEISGFKSFLDPVRVQFADGITAIVGPNGCGKSNLTDAINWVLGEQSAKSLRGAKMEDIIFNGSDKRKPVGMAEVYLNLACDDGYPRSVDGRIKIGRQVFRTGESRYRLNDKVVRLKEIKDLLMDTGLGIRAYSVIEQGKIGMILSGKPQERRKLLEEAAGITRYKARKRVAEVKLEETLGNLVRLDDIISEVDRSLRSLKRQASAARRYQAKESEYKDLLKQVLLGRWSLQKNQLDSLGRRLEELSNQDAELAANLSRDEAALVAGREELDRLAQVLAQRHQVVAELAATIEGRQEFIKGSRQRSTEMSRQLTRGRQQAEERRKQSTEFETSLGSLDQRTREVIEERDEAARQVAEDDRKIEAASREVQAAEARVDGLRREMIESVTQVNQIRDRLQKETVEIERQTYRLRYLDDERRRLDKQLAEAQGVFAEVSEKVQGAERGLEESVQLKGRMEQDLEGLLRREAEISDERRHLETHLAGLRQRQKILIQLSQEHEAKRRAMRRTLASIGIDEPVFLADRLQPAVGWEEPIDHFLGALADAVLVEDAASGLQAARALSKAGAVGVFVHPLPEGAPLPDLEDEALAYSLAEALDLPDELARSLPPAFLVDKADDADRLAAAHPGIAFLSREQIWARGGNLWVQGKEAAPGVLARESELVSIAEEIPDTERLLDSAKASLQQMVQERTRMASEIQKVEGKAAELRREIAVGQARRQDVENRRKKIALEHGTVADEQDELRRGLTERTSGRGDLTERLAAAEKNHQALQEGFEKNQAEVEAAKENREALRTEGAGRRGRLQLLEERLESQNQEAIRVRRQITYTEEQLKIWSQEDTTLDRRLGELHASIEAAETELQNALDRRVGAQDAVLEQQRILDDKREDAKVLEARVHRLRQERDALRAQISTQQVEQAGAKQDAEHLSASYRDAFKMYLPGTKSEQAKALAAEILARRQAELENPEPAADEDQGGKAGLQPAPAAITGAFSSGLEVPEGQTPGESESAVEEDDEDSSPEDGEPALSDQEVTALMAEDEAEIPSLNRGQLADLEGELARCKAILERLGPVNVLAAKEYEDQEERGTFLRKQRKDVAASVESLKQTIAEINELSSERFKATFEQVNKVFGETFQRLFRGGEAHMRLFDEDDVLETGIEIIARPPGKRPQNIMLLSGGEKALTAIALLFALFQSRPSPFCILDEVDAPLDDANVLRFVETLQEMAKDTQFLVVTHNKLTMEVAASLYGVTMEEKGVSKLVQAEMEDLHPQSSAKAGQVELPVS